jgi:hypothetical protein
MNPRVSDAVDIRAALLTRLSFMWHFYHAPGETAAAAAQFR